MSSSLDSILPVLTPDLFDQYALALHLYEDEAPLQGVLGVLDWKFDRQISKLLDQYPNAGAQDQFTYLPLRTPTGSLRLLIFGVGMRPSDEVKPAEPDDSTLIPVALQKLGAIQPLPARFPLCFQE